VRWQAARATRQLAGGIIGGRCGAYDRWVPVSDLAT